MTLQSLAHTSHLSPFPAEFNSKMALATNLPLSLLVLAFSVLKRLPEGRIWNRQCPGCEGSWSMLAVLL